MAWDTNPVVLTVAPCGSETTREHNPALPHTPAEIVESSVAAAAAGAGVVHLHVREDDGTPSARVDLFQAAVEGIRARSELVTMVSTGGALGMDLRERMNGLEARPDLAGVESGSMNFDDEPFVTSGPDGRAIIATALAQGTGLEVEAFEIGHVIQAVKWIEDEVLPRPLRINLVFGAPGGIDASPEALTAMIRPLPTDAFWTVTAVGRHQRRMLVLALTHGAGGIRVGLEDNVYLSRGRLAPSNAALVELAAQMARVCGREVATAQQTRELLAL